MKEEVVQAMRGLVRMKQEGLLEVELADYVDMIGTLRSTYYFKNLAPGREFSATGEKIREFLATIEAAGYKENPDFSHESKPEQAYHKLCVFSTEHENHDEVHRILMEKPLGRQPRAKA